MNNKIKKIIAREGLIILGFFVFGILWYILCDSILPTIYIFLSRKLTHSFAYLWNGNIEDIKAKADLCLFILFIGYPIYLLIRFIIWARRVLKQK
jgi:hypothetical protein